MNKEDSSDSYKSSSSSSMYDIENSLSYRYSSSYEDTSYSKYSSVSSISNSNNVEKTVKIVGVEGENMYIEKEASQSKSKLISKEKLVEKSSHKDSIERSSSSRSFEIIYESVPVVIEHDIHLRNLIVGESTESIELIEHYPVIVPTEVVLDVCPMELEASLTRPTSERTSAFPVTINPAFYNKLLLQLNEGATMEDLKNAGVSDGMVEAICQEIPYQMMASELSIDDDICHKNIRDIVRETAALHPTEELNSKSISAMVSRTSRNTNTSLPASVSVEVVKKVSSSSSSEKKRKAATVSTSVSSDYYCDVTTSVSSTASSIEPSISAEIKRIISGNNNGIISGSIFTDKIDSESSTSCYSSAAVLKAADNSFNKKKSLDCCKKQPVNNSSHSQHSRKSSNYTVNAIDIVSNKPSRRKCCSKVQKTSNTTIISSSSTEEYSSYYSSNSSSSAEQVLNSVHSAVHTIDPAAITNTKRRAMCCKKVEPSYSLSKGSGEKSSRLSSKRSSLQSSAKQTSSKALSCRPSTTMKKKNRGCCKKPVGSKSIPLTTVASLSGVTENTEATTASTAESIDLPRLSQESLNFKDGSMKNSIQSQITAVKNTKGCCKASRKDITVSSTSESESGVKQSHTFKSGKSVSLVPDRKLSSSVSFQNTDKTKESNSLVLYPNNSHRTKKSSKKCCCGSDDESTMSSSKYIAETKYVRGKKNVCCTVAQEVSVPSVEQSSSTYRSNTVNSTISKMISEKRSEKAKKNGCCASTPIDTKSEEEAALTSFSKKSHKSSRKSSSKAMSSRKSSSKTMSSRKSSRSSISSVADTRRSQVMKQKKGCCKKQNLNRTSSSVEEQKTNMQSNNSMVKFTNNSMVKPTNTSMSINTSIKSPQKKNKGCCKKQVSVEVIEPASISSIYESNKLASDYSSSQVELKKSTGCCKKVSISEDLTTSKQDVSTSSSGSYTYEYSTSSSVKVSSVKAPTITAAPVKVGKAGCCAKVNDMSASKSMMSNKSVGSKSIASKGSQNLIQSRGDDEGTFSSSSSLTSSVSMIVASRDAASLMIGGKKARGCCKPKVAQTEAPSQVVTDINIIRTSTNTCTTSEKSDKSTTVQETNMSHKSDLKKNKSKCCGDATMTSESSSEQGLSQIVESIERSIEETIDNQSLSKREATIIDFNKKKSNNCCKGKKVSASEQDDVEVYNSELSSSPSLQQDNTLDHSSTSSSSVSSVEPVLTKVETKRTKKTSMKNRGLSKSVLSELTSVKDETGNKNKGKGPKKFVVQTGVGSVNKQVTKSIKTTSSYPNKYTENHQTRLINSGVTEFYVKVPNKTKAFYNYDNKIKAVEVNVGLY